MRSTLIAGCVAAAALAGLPFGAHAQFDRNVPTYPSAPFNPTTRAECKALSDAWAAVRKDLNARHGSCLQAMGSGVGTSEVGGGCMYKECLPFHNTAMLGRADEAACDKAVRVIEEADRKAEAERKKEEAEEKRRKDKARADAEKRARDQEAEDRKTAREADDKIKADRAAAAEKRQKDRDAANAESKRKADEAVKVADAWERRQDAAYAERRAQYDAADRKREKLEAEAAKLSQDRARNAGSLSNMLDKASEAIAGATKGVKDAVAGVSTQPGASTSASDFDLSPSSGVLAPYSSIVKYLAAEGSPFASIPFALVRNATERTADITDQLTRTIDNLERSDGKELSDAFNAFGQKVVDPAVLGRSVFESSVGKYATRVVQDRVVTPVVEEALVATRLANSDGSFRGIIGPPSTTPQQHTSFWWEGRSGSRASAVVTRDSRGTPLLFDRSGATFRYDAGAGRTSYDAAHVETLVARNDVSLRYTTPRVWVRRSATFTPTIPDANDPWLTNRAINWVAREVTAPVTQPMGAVVEKKLRESQKP